jgi:hypothetical protein
MVILHRDGKDLLIVFVHFRALLTSTEETASWKKYKILDEMKDGTSNVDDV